MLGGPGFNFETWKAGTPSKEFIPRERTVSPSGDFQISEMGSGMARPKAVHLFEDYEERHHHQPSDEYQSDWDFRGNPKLARFGFVLGWLASERAEPTEWKPKEAVALRMPKR